MLVCVWQAGFLSWLSSLIGRKLIFRKFQAIEDKSDILQGLLKEHIFANF